MINLSSHRCFWAGNYGRAQWNLPSGKLEDGEDMIAAIIIREAREEIDVEVDRDDLEMVTSVHHLNPEGQAGGADIS
ncbi:NUDIX domain-containing protein [Amycolatopsis sp. cmx-4-68]|uniref:NUDIX domain-containing protein n=1 Tax=Amycolatopsis sp. cmx-4-68 TaxID=2790938 RepID=UPI00397C039F